MINFFQANCQSNTSATSFGICDNQNGTPAFIDTVNPNQWIAKAENDNDLTVTLTAVDNCIPVLRQDGTMDNRCDTILTYTDNLIFVELKNQRADWITHAILQIETTIQHFIANHNINNFKHKRAFAANKKHPHFQFGNPERSQRFFSSYRVRLNIEATIKIS